MSQRSGKRKKQGDKPKAKPEAESPRKRTLALFLRRPVTLIGIAGLLTLLVMAIVNGRQPPRVTVVNRTGDLLRDVHVDFPGGTASTDVVNDGGTGSMLLRPDPATPKPPGSGPITLVYRVGNGAPNHFFSRVHGQEYGAHDVITIVRQPDGAIIAAPSAPGGGGFRFGDLLRRIGIGR
jgi:hypothetical protein